MTTFLHRVLPAAALAAVAALALAACGSSTSSSSTAAATSSPSMTSASAPAPGVVSRLTLSADPGGQLAFDKTTLTAKAGTITLTLKNPASSGVQHGIAIRGQGMTKVGTIVAPGGTATVTATVRPGTYTYYCPVPGHEAAGMTGTLTVT